jgi:hypothetical protein
VYTLLGNKCNRYTQFGLLPTAGSKQNQAQKSIRWFNQLAETRIQTEGPGYTNTGGNTFRGAQTKGYEEQDVCGKETQRCDEVEDVKEQEEWRMRVTILRASYSGGIAAYLLKSY